MIDAAEQYGRRLMAHDRQSRGRRRCGQGFDRDRERLPLGRGFLHLSETAVGPTELAPVVCLVDGGRQLLYGLPATGRNTGVARNDVGRFIQDRAGPRVTKYAHFFGNSRRTRNSRCSASGFDRKSRTKTLRTVALPNWLSVRRSKDSSSSSVSRKATMPLFSATQVVLREG